MENTNENNINEISEEEIKKEKKSKKSKKKISADKKKVKVYNRHGKFLYEKVMKKEIANDLIRRGIAK